MVNWIIIIASGIFAIFQIPELSFRRFKAKPIILLLLGAVVCCLSILEQIRKDKAEKYASNVGTIRSPADGDKYPPVALGGAVFTFLDGYQGLQFLIDTTSFKLWVKDNKLYADALILSPDSAIIVRMTANEFQLNPGNYFDKNFNDSTLEVEDRWGNVVLQLQYKTDSIVVYGLFKARNRFNELVYPEGDGAAIEYRPPGHPFQGKINPIFAYPSATHPGQRL
jgi:hypothetical protein